MLKMAPSFVLGHSDASTYLPGTPQHPNSLAPRWMTILSILQFQSSKGKAFGSWANADGWKL